MNFRDLTLVLCSPSLQISPWWSRNSCFGFCLRMFKFLDCACFPRLLLFLCSLMLRLASWWIVGPPIPQFMSFLKEKLTRRERGQFPLEAGMFHSSLNKLLHGRIRKRWHQDVQQHPVWMPVM